MVSEFANRTWKTERRKHVEELIKQKPEKIIERFLVELNRDYVSRERFIIQHGNSFPILDKICQTLCQLGYDKHDDNIVVVALNCIYRLKNGREYVKTSFPDFLHRITATSN
jgi:hypothetical protein